MKNINNTGNICHCERSVAIPSESLKTSVTPPWRGPVGGTTIIEMIIYSALLITIMVALYSFYSQITIQKANQLAQAEIYTNGQRILFDFHQTVKQADSINYPTMGQNDNYLFLNAGTTTYQLDENNALEKTENGQTFKLTDNLVQVENLIFTNFGPSLDHPTVKISFNLTGRTYTYHFQTAVTLP
ncbi:hypothetical protein KKE45_03350 [Patescibacteria group bacterium]|nr:hypothetical protein [Patescibacteria group bacterium]